MVKVDHKLKNSSWVCQSQTVCKEQLSRLSSLNLSPNENSECEGFLWKEGKITHTWKKRWFLLKGSTLTYFTDEKKTVLCGSRTIIGVALWAGKVNGLQIRNGGNKEKDSLFHVHAENAKQQQRWFRALTAACTENLQRQHFGKSPKNTRGSGVMMNDFEIIKGIGKGGFGKVFLVTKKTGPDTKKLLAMKILSKELVKRTKQVQSTIAERQILLDISHPFVVNLRYSFQNSHKLYMVMDYFSGGSMYFHLCNERYFEPSQVKFFATELVLALGHLHKNRIVYRDLKLENILMDEHGHIAITDFGLAKLGIGWKDTTDTYCGTPVYMSPEILLNKKYGHGVDWWACGTVLYEVSVGRAPFQDRVRDKMFRNIVYAKIRYPSKLDPPFCALLDGLLTKDPARRLGSGRSGLANVQSANYFSSVDWEMALNKGIPPPFKPKSARAGENIEKKAVGMVARDTTCLTYENSEFEGFTFAGESQSEPRMPLITMDPDDRTTPPTASPMSRLEKRNSSDFVTSRLAKKKSRELAVKAKLNKQGSGLRATFTKQGSSLRAQLEKNGSGELPGSVHTKRVVRV